METEVTPKIDQTQETPTAPAQEKPTGKTFTQEEVDRIVKERLEREKTKAQELASKAAKDAAEKAAVANAEWEKLAKQRESELAELGKKVAATELLELKRKVARDVGLDDVYAPRLNGTTEEDITADAKAFLATLPKPAPKSPGPINTTNPGAATTQAKETDMQRLRRLHGISSNVFSADTLKDLGGGVYMPSTPRMKKDTEK